MSTPDSDAPISPLTGLGIAVLVVGASAILVRWSVAPSLVRALYRVLFTVALPAPVALVRHRNVLAAISRRNLLTAGGAGVALAAHFTSWLESLNHTTVAASITLVQFQPFFIAVDARAIFDGHVNRCTAVGIGVALASMTLMSVSDFLTAGGAPWPLPGNGLTVAGAVTAAAYVLTNRSIRSGVSLVPYVVIVYSVYTAALLVVMVDRGNPLTGYPPHGWFLFLGVAASPGIFGRTVINQALARPESSVASVSLPGEPVDDTILALFLLGGIPTLSTVPDGAIIFDGICVSMP